MTNYFDTRLTEQQLQSTSVLALAHIGDAVYDLLTRTHLCANGVSTASGLHRKTVSRVCAKAQSRAVKLIEESLTPEEHNAYKRGRNAKVNSVPKNANLSEYHAATGVEALFGYLYLKGDRNRINELFTMITREEDNAS